MAEEEKPIEGEEAKKAPEGPKAAGEVPKADGEEAIADGEATVTGEEDSDKDSEEGTFIDKGIIYEGSGEEESEDESFPSEYEAEDEYEGWKGWEEEGGIEEAQVEEVEEEVQVEQEVDPAAPYNLSESSEALKEPFQLRPEQLAEVEQLWDFYQDYNPAYTDIKDYITPKELVYMLKCLLLHPYTPEQLIELIEFCVKPPHPQEHITFEQFLRMVTIQWRNISAEDELRAALTVYDAEKSGILDREYVRTMLLEKGYKMAPKPVDNLIKEVDISNDGTINLEDIVGTMAIDLNKDDIELLKCTLDPSLAKPVVDDDDM